jgi:hypothetical protein
MLGNSLKRHEGRQTHEHNYDVTPQTQGRAIAEAVSRWLPTAAARVRDRVWQVGFVVDKVASGQVFSPSTSVSPTKCVHSTNFSILTITRGRYNSPGEAAVPSGPQYSNKEKTYQTFLNKEILLKINRNSLRR